MTETIQLKNGLYVIPTPIGNLKDVTLRALETLQAVDYIYCEDTRVSNKFLSHYGIKKPLRIYNEQSTEKDRHYIVETAKNHAIALISDAGMPLISDPGYKLIQQIKQENVYITVLPGACAFVTAIVASGIESDAFCFHGFFNIKKIEDYKNTIMTLVFYESCHSIMDTLFLCLDHFSNREIAICREITKLYEESVKGSPQDIIDYFKDSEKLRGEFVLLLSPPKDVAPTDHMIKEALEKAFSHSKGKDAVKFVAEQLNVSKKAVYAVYIQS